MDRDTESFEIVAEGAASALAKVTRECRSAAVVRLVLEREVTYPDPTYKAHITKVRSTSGQRSLTRIEKWETERGVLLRKARELTKRLRKIEERATMLSERIADAKNRR